LRQRLIERIIEEKITETGAKMLHQHKLENWADTEDGSEYPVVCFVRNLVADEVVQIRWSVTPFFTLRTAQNH